MKLRWLPSVLSCGTIACLATHPAGKAEPLATAVASRAPEQVHQQQPEAQPQAPSAKAERQERQVAVRGIEGTLSPFDVRTALEQQGQAFGSCHARRARRVPALSGSIEFKIHVQVSGEVSGVHVRSSDLGDRGLERCLSDVILGTHFPAPNGGQANVTWNMLLERMGRGAPPEQWELERVEKVLRKQRGKLLESCSVGRAAFDVTAYVSRRGRVITAGVAAKQESSAQHFDCIADGLLSWPMPRPRKGVAKVSFSIRKT